MPIVWHDSNQPQDAPDGTPQNPPVANASPGIQWHQPSDAPGGIKWNQPTTAPSNQPPTTRPLLTPGELKREWQTGLGRGAAGLLVGAGQMASDVLPSSITDPIAKSRPAQAIKSYAQAPSQSGVETAGKVVAGGLPQVFTPEFRGAQALIGGITGALQPTESGSLGSHLLGGGIGTIAGGVGDLLGGTPEQRAMRDAGVRITPGRIVPFIGREWERFVARLPVFNRLIAHGRQVSLNDFQGALYDDALQPLRALGGAVETPAGRGSAGLDQLRTVITDRLDSVLSGSMLPASSVPALRADLGNIVANASRDMSGDTLRRLNQILRMDVITPLAWSGGAGIPGARLAGRSGIIATLGNTSRNLWRSPDTQEKALAAALDRVQTALLDHATIGGGGRAELDAARQAYARYSTLMRAGSGVRAGGNIDAESLLGELRRANRDLFTRGGMRLQPFAQTARQAGVPRVSEAFPEFSPFEAATVGGGLAGLAHYFSPDVLFGLTPAALYNRPGMAAANALSANARQLTPFATAGSSQAVGATGVDPLKGIVPGL